MTFASVILGHTKYCDIATAMKHTLEPTFGNNEKPSVDANKPLEKILTSVNRINDELERINNHTLIKIYDSTYQRLFFYFIKGIVFGLGTVLGATIVVSILAYILAQFEFIPLVGEWVKAISDEINNSRNP